MGMGDKWCKGEDYAIISAMGQCSIVIKSTISGIRLLGFKSQLLSLKSCVIWASYLTSLCLHFPICKRGNHSRIYLCGNWMHYYMHIG